MLDSEIKDRQFKRFWYGTTIDEFTATDPLGILGQLTANCEFAVLPTQRDSWLVQIELLRDELRDLQGSIFLEFSIPRMGRRIDAVILTDQILFAVEFKVGSSTFERSAIEQVWDYALDLKNFHESSHTASIIPVLVATEADKSPSLALTPDNDQVVRPVRVASRQLRSLIELAVGQIIGDPIDSTSWAHASYHPTPTIIEAARSLYAQHSVEAIARYDAGAKNLRVTSQRIEQIVDDARSRQRKSICFVTGVPGAGKTLVGLNVATQRRDSEAPTHAVFLSGNGPLVAVLREALTRDEVERKKASGKKTRKREVAESVKAFIQNVHHFRDDLLVDSKPPAEHVAIFDEAQRAWNLDQTSKFMHRKKNFAGFSQSEPEFLIESMDRHKDWAVIICLVGGGQEINTGEAGIDAWIDAIYRRFPHWDMYISPRLTDSEYASGHALELASNRSQTLLDESLHLNVSMRSFRAENVSAFVKAVLDCDETTARDQFAQLIQRYPLALTRELQRAKDWVSQHARGSERFGLLASSKAHRLKPDAIDIRVDVDPVHWFLNDRTDTRSSYYLERV